MNTASWSPEERAEWEDLLEQVTQEAESTGDAVDMLKQLVRDAVQAQRFWANDVEDAALRTGLRSLVNAYKKRQRVLVSYQGELLNKARAIGVKHVAEDGSTWHAQPLIDVMTWDQLREKRREYLTQIRAYTSNVAEMDQLLALQEICPGAATPQEACEQLGTTVDEYLKRGEAA